MKKKLTCLLTALVMALGLCVNAAAEAPVLSGDLGDGLSWQIKAGRFAVQTRNWAGHIMAGYYRDGRLIQLRTLTSERPEVPTNDRATRIKLFRLNDNWTPKFQPVDLHISSVPDKVITDGIANWDDLTTPGSDHYVAPAFAKDCSYFFNDIWVDGQVHSLSPLQSAAIWRGTVTEFSLDKDGLIDQVNCHCYAVGQVENSNAIVKTLSDGTVQVRVPGVVSGWVDSDKITGWQDLKEGDIVLYYKTNHLDGTHYTLEKAEKVTGPVSSFDAELGTLQINGVDHYASEQINAGVFGDVVFDTGKDVFGCWTDTHNLVDEYDFFLDKSGAIVAAVQRTESIYTSRVCLVLSTQVTGGNLSAQLLLTDGSTKTITVSKVGINEGGKVVLKNVVSDVSNADRQISVTAARDALTGDAADTDATARFFSYRFTDSGYELTELNAANFPLDWETPASQGNGSAAFATILPMSRFAWTLGGANYLADWQIHADSSTIFIVGTRNRTDGTLTHSVYVGFRRVPEMDAARLTAICPHYNSGLSYVNTVADYVYILRTLN